MWDFVLKNQLRNRTVQSARPFTLHKVRRGFKLATGTALDYLLMVKSGDKTIVEISWLSASTRNASLKG